MLSVYTTTQWVHLRSVDGSFDIITAHPPIGHTSSSEQADSSLFSWLHSNFCLLIPNLFSFLLDLGSKHQLLLCLLLDSIALHRRLLR
jgi:hypothetical protein